MASMAIVVDGSTPNGLPTLLFRADVWQFATGEENILKHFQVSQVMSNQNGCYEWFVQLVVCIPFRVARVR